LDGRRGGEGSGLAATRAALDDGLRRKQEKEERGDRDERPFDACDVFCWVLGMRVADVNVVDAATVGCLFTDTGGLNGEVGIDMAFWAQRRLERANETTKTKELM